MDETDGVSDVHMTENRDIPDHQWPYVRKKFKTFGVKKDSWRMHCIPSVSYSITVSI